MTRLPRLLPFVWRIREGPTGNDDFRHNLQMFSRTLMRANLAGFQQNKAAGKQYPSRTNVRLSLGFHGDSAWKQNVVLQMNVLVQIEFKALQRLIERAITDAGVLRKLVIVANRTQ